MVTVRFYYDVIVDEDDIRENLELNKNAKILDEDIIDRARTLFAYNIQDREIHVGNLECEIIKGK